MNNASITEALAEAGWDRSTIAQSLTNSDVPRPPEPPRQKPAQVETVIIGMQGGAIQTRAGITTFFLSGSMFVLAFVIWAGILNVRDIITGTASSLILKESIVLLLSISVPASIVAWFSYRKLRRMLEKDPAVADDIAYKRNIRSSLYVSLSYIIFMTFIILMDVFQVLILSKPVSKGFFDITTSLIVSGGLSWIFWHYSKKSSN